jgi:SAM-dependent methyltransferase
LTFLLFCFLFASHLSPESYHTVSGTGYGANGSLAYATHRHGPDGAIFLDSYLISYLTDLDGLYLLDAGCGAAPWAIHAAGQGAKVFAIDLQEKMIELAKVAIDKTNLSDRITLAIGDVTQLPCPSDSFDKVLSINVGCNLPILSPHVEQMARVLKKGGLAIVTAPASFDTVFTDGTAHEKVFAHIFAVLQKTPPHPSPSEIISHLNELTEVRRATFAIREGQPKLIQDENELMLGEDIWRKLPGLTVPNRYHPESEYLQEFAQAGLTLKEHFHPRFSTPAEWIEYNASASEQTQLGEEYLHSPPFIIFCLTKSI